MLIKNEKSNATFFSIPETVPNANVVPLLLKPGNTAIAWAIPIIIAPPHPKGLGFLFFLVANSAHNKKKAVNRKPTPKNIKLVLSKSNQILANKTKITAGKVATTNIKFILQNGWVIKYNIFFL